MSTLLQTSTCKKDWRLDWGDDLSKLLIAAENAEASLSYLSPCKSEVARKAIGSYYTPTDVARYFWQEFFALNRITHATKPDAFWLDHHFIEPAAGAGALAFSLLQKGLELGLSKSSLLDTHLTIIDINQEALDFVHSGFERLSKKWGVKFQNIRYIHGDFCEVGLTTSPQKPLFFGNPPFVQNQRGARWKNLYADFVERSVLLGGSDGRCHFILPLSVAFSRDYTKLRDILRFSGKSIALSSFDNIPDTLFVSGKPEHLNTNKANSQRCSIITIFPESDRRILSSRMHRWKKVDRRALLTKSPVYHDISAYDLDDQFPRPESGAILQYLLEANEAPKLREFTTEDGRYELHIASVARNFIGLREVADSGTHTLRFANAASFYSALLILTSDLFMQYWRTVGDGFHVTKGNILDFPIHPQIQDFVESKSKYARKMWSHRKTFSKQKRHPNGMTLSYDFTPWSLSLLEGF